MADVQLKAVKAAKLIVVNLHEDDAGVWFCTLADHFRAPMATWKTGRGKTVEDAMDNALGFYFRPKRAAAPVVAPAKRKAEDDLI